MFCTVVKSGIRYVARLNESVLVDARAEQTRGLVPSAECVVSCLGAPERYRAYFTRSIPGHKSSFQMLFPSQGTWASGTRFYGLSQEQPPRIAGSFPTYYFRFAVPGTSEDLLHKIYGSTSVYEGVVDQFKPWPTDWNGIEIDIDPSLPIPK